MFLPCGNSLGRRRRLVSGVCSLFPNHWKGTRLKWLVVSTISGLSTASRVHVAILNRSSFQWLNFVRSVMVTSTSSFCGARGGKLRTFSRKEAISEGTPKNKSLEQVQTDQRQKLTICISDITNSKSQNQQSKPIKINKREGITGPS